MEALAAHVTLIQAEAERLAQYLATVPPDAWRQPSACQGWEVRDVVAHLIQGAQFYVHTISRGCRETWSGLQNSHRLPSPGPR
jgi:uncharacterized protein (TIGR03083 family)